ncbi:MAG: DUF6080 domain-containing protein [Flavobacteriaceae bacterium]|jgi:hypothetical protein|nr:DUF6080 domain-containing protein [Flavobacteriaceae bacterium]
MKNFFNEIKTIIHLILPDSKKEFFILLIFILLYYPLGIYLSLTTNIIDGDRTDMYFGFDNGICLYLGSGEPATHPLTQYFYIPLTILYQKIQLYNIHEKTYTLFVVFLCSLFIAWSNLFIFKYLKNIIKLNLKICCLLTLFFSFFGGAITLSFTPETFTFTLFLLTANLYLASYFLSKGTGLSYFYYIISGTLITGQTITNAPKVLIPIIFEKKLSLKNILYSFLKIAVVTVFITYLSTALILRKNQWDLETFLLYNVKRKGWFQAEGFSAFDSFISYFLGGNTLFPSSRIDKSPYMNQEIYLNFYDSWYQYLFIFIIILLMGFAIVMNSKNKLFWILILTLPADLFYHYILKVGIDVAFLYGGHFIFVIPLILGWLFKVLSPEKQRFLGYLLTGLTIMLIFNNGYRIWQFIQLAQSLYPNNS